jgi:hypothetical protein
MRSISIVSLVLATLLGVGAAYWTDGGEKPRRHWPKPTPPPPASPLFTTSAEHAWSEEEIAQQARDHNAQLEMEIERALASHDAQRREAVFTFILPELVQVDPSRLVAMVARQRSGEARDTLRSEVTRQWLARDSVAAVEWMKTLPEDERRANADTVVDIMLANSPDEAVALADELGIAGLVRERLKGSRD